MNNIAKLAKAIMKSKKLHRTPKIQIPTESLLSTGFTPLNVHCTGRTRGGFGKGLFIFLVGDSSSGKTWLSHTCLAEATINEEFDGYDFYYDNIENGALMDLTKFFGQAVADRLMPPKGDWDNPVNSRTSEDLYDNLHSKLTADRPCIYIVDSETALMPADDLEKFIENKNLRAKGKKTKGNYGMAKAKTNSANLRVMIPLLEKSGSILIMISQTRQNVAMFSFEDRTRAGGLSLRFYAHLELWTKIIKKIKKEVKGKDRHVGTIVEIDVKKNRLSGWEGKLKMPFLKQTGIDNTGGCIDYLIEEGFWRESSKVINAKQMEVKLKREELIQHIEKEGIEPMLHSLVRKCFEQVQVACTFTRKMRYS